MKTLAERHADRARRKAENAKELNPSNEVVGNSTVDAAHAQLHEALVSVEALSPEDQDKVRELLAADPPTASVPEAYENRAGIGVFNPLVVPVAQSGDGAGTATSVGQTAWGSPPTAEQAATQAPGSTADAKPAKAGK